MNKKQGGSGEVARGSKWGAKDSLTWQQSGQVDAKGIGVGVRGITALRLTNAEARVKENPWSNASFPAWRM